MSEKKSISKEEIVQEGEFFYLCHEGTFFKFKLNAITADGQNDYNHWFPKCPICGSSACIEIAETIPEDPQFGTEVLIPYNDGKVENWFARVLCAGYVLGNKEFLSMYPQSVQKIEGQAKQRVLVLTYMDRYLINDKLLEVQRIVARREEDLMFADNLDRRVLQADYNVISKKKAEE